MKKSKWRLEAFLILLLLLMSILFIWSLVINHELNQQLNDARLPFPLPGMEGR